MPHHLLLLGVIASTVYWPYHMKNDRPEKGGLTQKIEQGGFSFSPDISIVSCSRG